jgi:hypothetical protein
LKPLIRTQETSKAAAKEAPNPAFPIGRAPHLRQYS